MPYSDDWQRAERILREEAQRASSSADARCVMEELRRRYPVGPAEVEPRVFVRATDSWVELSAQFLGAGPQRSRGMDTVRRLFDRFVEDPITVASTAQDIALHHPAPRE